MNESRRVRIRVRLIAFSLLLANLCAPLLSGGAYITGLFYAVDRPIGWMPFVFAGATAAIGFSLLMLVARAWSFNMTPFMSRISSICVLTLGDALFIAGISFEGFSSYVFLALSGACLAIAYEIMLVLWGCALSSLTLRESVVHVGISAALSAVISLVLMSTGSTLVMGLAFAVLPLFASLGNPAKAIRASSDSANGVSSVLQTQLHIPWKLLGGMFICSIVLMSMWRIPEIGAELPFAYIITRGTFFGFAASSVTLSVLAFMHPNETRLQSAATHLCPLFAALPLIPCIISINPEGIIGFVFGLCTGVGLAYFATLPIALLFQEVASDDYCKIQNIWGSIGLTVATGGAIGAGISQLLPDESMWAVTAALLIAYLVVLAMTSHAASDKAEYDGDESRNRSSLADPIKSRCIELANAYSLTPREAEVLEYLAHGRPAAYAAEKLYISTDTAKVHIKHMYEKMGIHSRQELLDLVQEQINLR